MNCQGWSQKGENKAHKPMHVPKLADLEGSAAVCIRALRDGSQEAVKHQALNVGACQGQQVVQAPVPSLEGAHLGCVLPKAQGHRVQ